MVVRLRSILAGVWLALAAGPLRADAGTGRLLPERVVLSDSLGGVTFTGRGYCFSFEGAPVPEAVARIARVFRVPIAYCGSASREITSRVEGATAAEVLSGLAERTGLACDLDGTMFRVREDGTEPAIPANPGPPFQAGTGRGPAGARRAP